MDLMEESADRENGGQGRQRGGPAITAARTLNLPPGMSRDALQLDSIARTSWRGPGSPMKQNLSNVGASNVSSSSPVRTSYSDRFIPSRSSSNLMGFALLDRSPSGANIAQANDNREDNAAAYSLLLRSELFGTEASPPATPDKALGLAARDPIRSPISPTNGNLFRFKSDVQVRGSISRPESPYSLSPVGLDANLNSATISPRKVPRKIARSPCKVLDAPALQDDLYLNLVGHRTMCWLWDWGLVFTSGVLALARSQSSVIWVPLTVSALWAGLNGEPTLLLGPTWVMSSCGMQHGVGKYGQ
ncbi:hypothetical protein CY35_02G167500 [Sphagnum magellanicum]|nr:hypothetical protein CY35_02G167500 [Sphagnum magellanicum]